jgi:NTE family protein
VELYATRQNFQRAIAYLSDKLAPEAKHDPEVRRILRLGKEHVLKIVHIIYKASEFAHSFKDYNFSKSTVQMRMNKGHKEASEVLANPYWKYQEPDVIHSLPEPPPFTPPEHAESENK